MLSAAIEAACNSIAPNWPLDRFIAVNPYWGRIDQPFEQVSRTLTRLANSRLYMPLAYYRAAWQEGRIRREHLLHALAEYGARSEEQALIALLDLDEPAPIPLPLLSDVLDSKRDISHEPTWRDTITQQITQFCAAYFDGDQADWHPYRHEGFYASWRRVMAHDHHVALLMHDPGIRRRVRGLPEDPETLFTWAIEKLEVPADHLAELLQVLLLRINGWAAWCAYLRWQARLKGEDDTHIVDMLAIRLAWECLLDDGHRTPESAWSHWRYVWLETPHEDPGTIARALEIWQRAHEISYQRPLLEGLTQGASSAPRGVSAQAAFCIDVRSEFLRRALESVEPSVQTIGVAGNFGLPISYTPIGTEASRPQLPGLVAPTLRATDGTGNPEQDRELASRRRTQLNVKESWQPFYRLPGSAFTLVESLGLSYLDKIIRRCRPKAAKVPTIDGFGLDKAQAKQLHPQLDLPTEDPTARAELAAGVLRTLGLTEGFARLVLLVGHGSRSANNPHAAALDCGACGGQSGEVNVRLLAGLLNDPAVRAALADRAIHVPAETHFLPALHQTVTDEVTLLDRTLVPASHADDLERIARALLLAGDRARAQRAPSLGLAHLASRPEELARALESRSKDWSQTRPEWGQANNASFIVAPRERSRGLDLDGRAFLHDYDPRTDADGSVLEQIMTGPMVVTHWINMQYYASTVDNLSFGSGNKVLHNVVCGRIGVFEGNGGDLRIGLSMQSVHDGGRWMHAPLRLSVVIEASREAIDAIVAKHATVRQLLDNRWIHLFRVEEERVESRLAGEWVEWSETGPATRNR